MELVAQIFVIFVVSPMTKLTPYKELADYFISLSNETGNLISNLKLQKLLYYAQAWHLAYFENRLINEDFEAWVHGPVLPKAYLEFCDFGWKPIFKEHLNQNFINNFCSEIITQKQCELLNDVVNEYFGLTAFQLEKLTHSENPWKIARGDLAPDIPSSKIITDKSMIDYYQQFVVSV